jgi:hypothetical protein
MLTPVTSLLSNNIIHSLLLVMDHVTEPHLNQNVLYGIVSWFIARERTWCANIRVAAF